jgi:PHD/YefM family antitoxin component YafN of YafNO toxin-antitoxin module
MLVLACPYDWSIHMVRRLSSSEARRTLDSTLRSLDESGEGVIIEVRGKPRYAIVPFAEFEALQRLNEKQRRESILQELFNPGDRIGES